jgi:GH15 family glucan-1,4-alpha-glucosidase
MNSGYRDEALAWRRWLLRAVAGSPEQMQPLYGVAGERRLPELELPWLRGYADSRPVRIGNLARTQVQHDVLGEMMDALHVARAHHLDSLDDAWQLQVKLVEFMEKSWSDPDRGIWEMRGPPRHFTHSKVMAWVALDRAAKAVTRFGLPGPAERWRAVADEIHAEVCREGFDEGLNSFVQYYGGESLDGALLMLPLVGFLPPEDPRIAGTVKAIRERLCVDGLVRRYVPDDDLDGMPGGEGVFLACSFWLVDNLALMGRGEEATALFERLLGFCNDLGLLAEEYDPRSRRQLGNFPQAFSHISLVNSAHNLGTAHGPAPERAARGQSRK